MRITRQIVGGTAGVAVLCVVGFVANPDAVKDLGRRLAGGAELLEQAEGISQQVQNHKVVLSAVETKEKKAVSALSAGQEAEARLHFDSAEYFYDAAVRAAQRSLQRDPTSDAAMEERLRAGVALGAFWYHRGHMDKAEKILKEAEVNSKSSALSLVLAEAERFEVLGNVYRDMGRYKEARRQYETAEHLLVRSETQDERIEATRALLLAEQAWLLNKQEKLTEADNAMTAALKALTAAHAGKDQEALATGRLGAIQHDEGFVAAAMTNYISALQTELASGADGCSPDAFETLQNMAVGQRDLGKGTASISTIERAVNLQKQQLEAEQKVNEKVEDKALMASLARSYALGAELLRGSDKSKCAKGLRWAHEALSLQQRVDGDVLKTEQADILNTIGNVQSDLGRYNDAGNSYKASLSIHEKLEPNGNTATTASVYGNLGSLLHRQGRFQEAITMYEKSMKLQEAVLAPSNPDIAVTCNNLAVSLTKLGKLEDALEYAKRAVALVDESDLQESNGDKQLFGATLKHIQGQIGKQAAHKSMRVQEQ